MEEAREMLRDALLLMLETNREDAERELEGREGITRELLPKPEDYHGNLSGCAREDA